MSTGASRETREISPKMNSSATRSASTATVSRGNDSTIRASCACKCSSSWLCLADGMRFNEGEIVSRHAARPRVYFRLDSFERQLRLVQFHAHFNHVQRGQLFRERAQIDDV